MYNKCYLQEQQHFLVINTFCKIQIKQQSYCTFIHRKSFVWHKQNNNNTMLLEITLKKLCKHKNIVLFKNQDN